MRGTIGYILWGVGAYAVFMALFFPASLAYDLVGEKYPTLLEKVQLSRISGSCWSGSAVAATVGGKVVKDLQWQLHPADALRGKIGYSLSGRPFGGFFQGEVAAGRKTLTGEDFAIEVPGAVIGNFFTDFGIATTGRISGVLSRAVFSGGRLTGLDGRFVWQQAGIDMTEIISLGDISVVVSAGEEGQLKAVIKDTGGPMEAEGVALLNRDGTYTFSGLFVARPGSQQDLRDILDLAGQAHKSGKRKIALQGRLTGLDFL